jgi:hypothetical protein
MTPDEQRAAWRAAHYKNREKRLARMRAYHAAHHERHKEVMRDRHQRIRETDNVRRREAHWAARTEESLAAKREATYAARQNLPWKSLLRTAEARAKRKKVPFLLDAAWAAARYTGFCELTGLPFSLAARGSGPTRLSPSIDRIVPSVGYTPDNCRFVLWQVNAFKYDGTDAEMLVLAQAIVRALTIKTQLP